MSFQFNVVKPSLVGPKIAPNYQVPNPNILDECVSNVKPHSIRMRMKGQYKPVESEFGPQFQIHLGREKLASIGQRLFEIYPELTQSGYSHPLVADQNDTYIRARLDEVAFFPSGHTEDEYLITVEFRPYAFVDKKDVSKVRKGICARIMFISSDI